MTLAMCLAFLRYLGRQFYQPGAGALCRTVAPGAGAGAGVGKVAIGGVIPQQINVDISLAKMAARGITLNQLAAILARLNVVSSAGEIRVGSESIRLHPTGEFQSIDELGDLLVSPHGASATTRLRDIATLSRGLTDSPASIYHANGRQAVTMGVSFIPGVNVIDVGHALEARLQQMAADKPAGINIAIFTIRQLRSPTRSMALLPIF